MPSARYLAGVGDRKYRDGETRLRKMCTNSSGETALAFINIPKDLGYASKTAIPIWQVREHMNRVTSEVLIVVVLRRSQVSQA